MANSKRSHSFRSFPLQVQAQCDLVSSSRLPRQRPSRPLDLGLDGDGALGNQRAQCREQLEQCEDARVPRASTHVVPRGDMRGLGSEEELQPERQARPKLHSRRWRTRGLTSSSIWPALSWTSVRMMMCLANKCKRTYRSAGAIGDDAVDVDSVGAPGCVAFQQEIGPVFHAP